MTKEFKLMQGNVALAEGAVYAGCRFYAGYPITPSTEIMEEMSARLPRVGGRFIQMEDEIASISAIVGSSLAGVKSMTATSGPGFSLMQETIGYACITETPMVLVNVMRGGPSTGLPTSPAQGDILQARWGTHGDHPIIVLSPANVEEMFTQAIKAFNLSEQLRNPVIILADEVIGHMRERIAIPDEGQIPIVNRMLMEDVQQNMEEEVLKMDVPPMNRLGVGQHFHTTGLAHNPKGFPSQDPKIVDALMRRLHQKIYDRIEAIEQVEEQFTEDADLIITCIGGVTRSAEAALHELRDQGYNVGLFRPITLFPFPRRRMRMLAKHGTKILVAEMSLGQLHRVVANSIPDRRRVFGLTRVDGEVISPDEIIDMAIKALEDND